MKKLYTVYGLQCPDCNKIKYVGSTDNIKNRFFSHLSEKSKTEKAKWIIRLKEKNKAPVLIIFESNISSIKIARKKEQSLINSLPSLYNKKRVCLNPMKRYGKLKTKVFSFQLPKVLANALNKRLKELDTDKSKYIRQLILAEILMKSQPNNSLKSLLNP